MWMFFYTGVILAFFAFIGLVGYTLFVRTWRLLEKKWIGPPKTHPSTTDSLE